MFSGAATETERSRAKSPALALPGRLTLTYAPAEYVSIALCAVLLVIAAALGYRAWKASRVTPNERERLRRAALAATGKTGDASLVEYRDANLFYSYLVRGVEYTACQEVSSLIDRLPEDLSRAGAISVKYDPKNPANSIVVAEQWSGLHK